MFTDMYKKQCEGITCYHNFVMEKGLTSRFGQFGALQDEISITIKNISGSPQGVNLLQPDRNPKLKISANAMPMGGFVNRLNANPMLVSEIKVIGSDEEQLNNPIKFIYNDELGSYQSTIITPSSYENSYQSRGNIVEIKKLKFIFGIDGSIETTINPNSTVTYVMQVKQLFNDRRNFMQYKNFLNQKQTRYKNFMWDVIA